MRRYIECVRSEAVDPETFAAAMEQAGQYPCPAWGWWVGMHVAFVSASAEKESTNG